MAYELFYAPGACSMAIHIILNEVNQPVTLHKVDFATGGNRAPEFLKLNPRGQVPLLIEDGKPLREGGAIIAYLCDQHHCDLLPKSGWERAQALQWLMFANASLHVGYSKAMFIGKAVPEGAARDAAMTAACSQIQAMWDEIEAHLSAQGKPYLCGDACTAGDILTAVIANWSFLPQKFNFGPKTKALLKNVTARPAYQKALATEQVEYKAAA